MRLPVSAPVPWEPLLPLLPDHAPEATQSVAFVLFHVSVELPPLDTELGLAVKDIVGAGEGAALLTLTVIAVDVLELPAASRAVAVSV